MSRTDACRNGRRPRSVPDRHMVVPRFTDEEIATIDRYADAMRMSGRSEFIRFATICFMKSIKEAE